MNFAPLASSLKAEEVGNKFANLGRVAPHVRVPRALCVATDVFRSALSREQLVFLERFTADLRATVGCFLLDNLPELSAFLETIELPERYRSELLADMCAVFGSPEDLSVAVRSSGASEDAATTSFAGIYRSKLGVKGIDAICSAIEEVWRSFYGYPALMARFRSGCYDPLPNMAVIIQEMVPARMAGVAFTSGPRCVRVEYVFGLGETLVSGATAPGIYATGDGIDRPPDVQATVRSVEETVLRLRALMGHEIDVEWAADAEGVCVLQVRPVTEGLGGSSPTPSPFFRSSRLYLDETLPAGMQLGDCAQVYVGYVSKRAPAYRLAASVGIATGAAHVVDFNGAGMSARWNEMETLLANTPAPDVVLDMNSNVRQIVVPKKELRNVLNTSFSLAPGDYQRHTVIVRDFVRGQYGFISRKIDVHGLLIEYSDRGLLDINRGLSNCNQITITDFRRFTHGGELATNGSVNELNDFQQALPHIHRFTEALNREVPGAQLEWVLQDGVPHFIDFSREQARVDYRESHNVVLIAPGVARGPILLMEEDDLLHRLSVGPAVSVDKSTDVLEHRELKSLVETVAAFPRRPIIFTSRPYAILTVFFEHAAGFVFTEGSLLCHLSILLRETNTPAVIWKGVQNFSGKEAVISDGQLSIF